MWRSQLLGIVLLTMIGPGARLAFGQVARCLAIRADATTDVESSGGGSPSEAAAYFTLVASFKGTFLSPFPWSPAGQRLAFLGKDGLYVFDGDQPDSPPRRVLVGAGSNIAWSPDGNWIACRIQSTEEMRRGLASIKVVDVTAAGPVATTLIEKSDAGRIVWTASGVICYWERHTGLRRDLMAPMAWSATNSVPFHDQPWIVPYYDQQLKRVVASRLVSMPTVTQKVLTAFTSPTCSDVLLKAVRADGVQLLVDVIDSVTGSQSLLTDVDGNTIADLSRLSGLAHFDGTAFGSSGYLLGHTEEGDGHTSTGTLYVVSTQGEPVRRIQNAVPGFTPKMSATGALIAYQTSDAGDIHVGTLQVQ